MPASAGHVRPLILIGEGLEQPAEIHFAGYKGNFDPPAIYYQPSQMKAGRYDIPLCLYVKLRAAYRNVPKPPP